LPGARFSKNRKFVVTQLRRIYDRKIVVTELRRIYDRKFVVTQLRRFYDFSKIGPQITNRLNIDAILIFDATGL